MPLALLPKSMDRYYNPRNHWHRMLVLIAVQSFPLIVLFIQTQILIQRLVLHDSYAGIVSRLMVVLKDNVQGAPVQYWR